MRWFRWLTGPGSAVDDREPPAANQGTADGLDAGTCEVCGSPLRVRTRRSHYRGRVECRCGHRNHVEFHPVRSQEGTVHRHVTLTVGRRFEAATHEPDLRLSWRYGVCQSCSTAVNLLDAFVIAGENALGDVETFAYYCRTCHVHDDARRGRLLGHDREHVVDTLRFAVR